jgi:hypothetical protein
MLRYLDDLGDRLTFYGRAVWWMPRVLVHYRREVIRLLAEVSFGSGALAVVGGTVGVIAFMTFFTGTEVGLQGYEALNQIGSSAFAGFISAYFNTREISPLVAALALSATVWAVDLLIDGTWAVLVVAAVVGAVVYGALLWLLARESLRRLAGTVRPTPTPATP